MEVLIISDESCNDKRGESLQALMQPGVKYRLYV